MRLTAEEITLLRSTVKRILGDQVEIRVFGSRLDSEKRGGDLDLVIQTPFRVSFDQKAELSHQLPILLGMPIDIVFISEGEKLSAFQKLALTKSVSI